MLPNLVGVVAPLARAELSHLILTLLLLCQTLNLLLTDIRHLLFPLHLLYPLLFNLVSVVAPRVHAQLSHLNLTLLLLCISLNLPLTDIRHLLSPLHLLYPLLFNLASVVAPRVHALMSSLFSALLLLCQVLNLLLTDHRHCNNAAPAVPYVNGHIPLSQDLNPADNNGLLITYHVLLFDLVTMYYGFVLVLIM